MITDTIADMLTRIRNANLAYKSKVLVTNTKINNKICQILKENGFIHTYYISDKNSSHLWIILKYIKTFSSFKGKPSITNLKRLSKPGLRIYSSYKNIPRIFGGLGILIISTPKGLMTDHKARFFKLGGELICSIW